MNNKLVKAQKPLVRSLVRDLQTAAPLIALVEVCRAEELPFKYHEECETDQQKEENWKRFLSFMVEEKVVDEEFSETCESAAETSDTMLVYVPRTSV
jgi:hypothetical protein